MSKATMTVEGFLSADPEFREAQGKAVANFSVPHTARRLNKQSNQWEDVGDTLWVRVALWERDAELAREHLSKGVLVRVEGEPVLKSWERDGKSGTNLELKFASWSIIPRQDGGSQGRSGGASARNDEPWAATPTVAPVASQPDVWNQPTAFNDETPF
jgi:single-strand DNA-binding protein